VKKLEAVGRRSATGWAKAVSALWWFATAQMEQSGGLLVVVVVETPLVPMLSLPLSSPLNASCRPRVPSWDSHRSPLSEPREEEDG